MDPQQSSSSLKNPSSAPLSKRRADEGAPRPLKRRKSVAADVQEDNDVQEDTVFQKEVMCDVNTDTPPPNSPLRLSSSEQSPAPEPSTRVGHVSPDKTKATSPYYGMPASPVPEPRRKVRYVSPNETSTSPYYRPTSPEYGPSTYE